MCVLHFELRNVYEFCEYSSFVVVRRKKRQEDIEDGSLEKAVSGATKSNGEDDKPVSLHQLRSRRRPVPGVLDRRFNRLNMYKPKESDSPRQSQGEKATMEVLLRRYGAVILLYQWGGTPASLDQKYKLGVQERMGFERSEVLEEIAVNGPKGAMDRWKVPFAFLAGTHGLTDDELKPLYESLVMRVFDETPRKTETAGRLRKEYGMPMLQAAQVLYNHVDPKGDNPQKAAKKLGRMLVVGYLHFGKGMGKDEIVDIFKKRRSRTTRSKMRPDLAQRYIAEFKRAM